jgi:hypothetical protein
MSTVDPMHKKPGICHWEETTSFYGLIQRSPLVKPGERQRK